ncbi:MAG: phage tail domain-containing protein [Candidatus Spyradocola sp.]
MKSLTWVSDSGAVIQFNQSFPFYVSGADLNTAGASFSEMKPAGMDGVYTAGGSYDVKIIRCPGQIVATSPADLERRRNQLAMACNVRREGWLVSHQHDGTRRKIRCRPTHNPEFEGSFGLGEKFTVEFRCDRPYWLSYDEIIQPIGQIIPLMAWPWAAPVLMGYAVAELTLHNGTGIEIPTRIEVLSHSTLIKLTRTCGADAAVLEVAAAIAEGQKLVIDGTTGDIFLQDLETGETANASNRLAAGSRPITLLPGENRIELDNGVAGATPLSYIIYNEHSLAV